MNKQKLKEIRDNFNEPYFPFEIESIQSATVELVLNEIEGKVKELNPPPSMGELHKTGYTEAKKAMQSKLTQIRESVK